MTKKTDNTPVDLPAGTKHVKPKDRKAKDTLPKGITIKHTRRQLNTEIVPLPKVSNE